MMIIHFSFLFYKRFSSRFDIIYFILFYGNVETLNFITTLIIDLTIEEDNH